VQKCGRSKSRTFTVVILFFLDVSKNTFIVSNKQNKVILVDGSNNAGTQRGGAPAVGNQRGFKGGAPDPAAILQLFFKKYAFLGIVWSKFHVFKWLNKMLMGPQVLRPGARAPTYPLSLLRHWAQKQRQYIFCCPFSILVFSVA